MLTLTVHKNFTRSKIVSTACLLLCVLFWAFGSAHAAVVVTITEVGSDVQMSGTGTINLSGLTFNSAATISPLLEGDKATALLGSTPTASALLYDGATGPANFGAGGGFTLANSGLGPALGVTSTLGPPLIYVPAAYVSGTSITSSATFTGKSYASLGLSFGVYVYTWSSDKLTVIIGLPAAPVVTAVGGPGQAQLSWTVPVSNGPAITGYAVRYRPVGGVWSNWTFSGTGTNTTVTGLTAGTTYEFSVAAVNGRGTGAEGSATAVISVIANNVPVPMLSGYVILILCAALAMFGSFRISRRS